MPDDTRKEQANRALRALALVAFGLMLASCGKKPGAVDPPPGTTNDNFPLTYPDPATDPKP
ncbi:MAG: hypothetical protein SFW62_07285 [Alphaproteobacteria bacterium]|nr:hypothetical protein [Alphaproteobacteria bacterium]